MGLNIVDINVFSFNVYKRFYFCQVFTFLMSCYIIFEGFYARQLYR